jgi:hypothetical protein
VEDAIELLTATIQEEDQQKLLHWQKEKDDALIAAKKEWDDKFWKFYTTETKYVNGLMTTWENSNPKPLLTLL